MRPCILLDGFIERIRREPEPCFAWGHATSKSVATTEGGWPTWSEPRASGRRRILLRPCIERDMKTPAHDALHALRHSASHIMAQAIRRLHPETKLAIGPPIDTGFYYDVDCPVRLRDVDLPQLEVEMRKIIEANYPFQQSFVSKAEALQLFGSRGEPFKLEIIRELQTDRVSLFSDGEFLDLCEGPHVKATGDVQAFKLLSVAGSYWRGHEKNPQLQRIYGTAFPTQPELDTFLRQLEAAKARDHRKLGQELGLFSIEEDAGAGFVFYPPKGARIRLLIEERVRDEHLRRGYQPVSTPHLFKAHIWRTSGHLEHYRDAMFLFEHDGQEYTVKPMNCPGHILIYQSALRSYRELPLRLFELGTVYRAEKGGVLHGLLRVRGFTQDDAHIFCRPDQLVEELQRVMTFAVELLQQFGFEQYQVELSTRPAQFIGTPAAWEQAEAALMQALTAVHIPFERCEGAGAFYGPKIDVKITDAIGRAWQCSTIQCDFALPERFHLRYIGEDGKEQRPVMLHRAILGSLERFFGILIEHYAGAFPLWLAPVQAVVIPIAERHQAYAQQVTERLRAASIRVEADLRNEKMQAKIRDAQQQQIPYMLVVGDREQSQAHVAVRHRKQGDQGSQSVEQFLQQVREDVQGRR